MTKNEIDLELHLTPAKLQAIGLLSVRWSYFETEMDFTISALRAIVNDDRSIPSQFNQRTKRLRQLARRWFKKQDRLDRLFEIIDRAKNIHDNRCIVLHGRVYGPKNHRDPTIHIDHHRQLNEWLFTPYKATAAELRIIARDIEETTAELIKFNKEHLPASPQSLPKIYG